MPNADTLTPADPSDLAAALAFALRYQGRKRVHNADEIMAEIVARRLVEHLERADFVVMRKPPEIGAAALGRARRGLTNAPSCRRSRSRVPRRSPRGRAVNPPGPAARSDVGRRSCGSPFLVSCRNRPGSHLDAGSHPDDGGKRDMRARDARASPLVAGAR